MPSQSTLIGAAGEHFVLFQLLSHGYIAATAPQGAPTADLVICDAYCQKLCTVQVKTRRAIGSDQGWHMKKKHEREVSGLYFCFVDLPLDESKMPITYVIPSAVVADALCRMHQLWLSLPGVKGQQRKDSDFRRLVPDYEKTLGPAAVDFGAGWLAPYSNAWNRLGLKPSEQNVTDHFDPTSENEVHQPT